SGRRRRRARANRGVLGGEVAGELAKTMRARGSEASLARIVSAQAPDAVRLRGVAIETSKRQPGPSTSSFDDGDHHIQPLPAHNNAPHGDAERFRPGVPYH